MHSAPSLNLLEIEVSSPLPVLVTLYRGPAYESGTLIWSGAAPLTSWTISAASGSYSATALYVIGGDSVLVVDGNDLATAALETCDGTCFGQGRAILDLKLED